MSVKINIPSYLQRYTNDQEVVEVKGSSVNECINHLAKQFSDMRKMLFAKDGRMLDYVSIYCDGEFTYADELTKAVKDGDELNIMYILGGG